MRRTAVYVYLQLGLHHQLPGYLSSLDSRLFVFASFWHRSRKNGRLGHTQADTKAADAGHHRGGARGRGRRRATRGAGCLSTRSGPTSSAHRRRGAGRTGGRPCRTAPGVASAARRGRGDDRDALVWRTRVRPVPALVLWTTRCTYVRPLHAQRTRIGTGFQKNRASCARPS